MDPGEQITGTRDEHYNLVSVLYHALHGAETMEEYILDAEAAGDEEMATFFREAQLMQVQLAERAKGMLGIVDVAAGGAAGGIGPGDISGGIGGGAAIGDDPLTEEVPPEGGLGPGDITGGMPPAGAVPEDDEALLLPGEDAVLRDEEFLATTDIPADTPGATGVTGGDIAPDDIAIAEDVQPRSVPSDIPPSAGEAVGGTATGGAMQEYEQSQSIDAPPEEVFAWLSDVGNLPKYLPPVTDASVQGPSAEGTPGQRIRTTLEYPGGEGSFDSEGYFSVDERERRLEWGAEAGRDYSGWLTVGNHGAGGSEVIVHLSFGPRSVEPEMQERSGDRNPLEEGITATLESIRRQIEEGSGKVDIPPPPEGVEPDTGDNPAVVRDDPPPGTQR